MKCACNECNVLEGKNKPHKLGGFSHHPHPASSFSALSQPPTSTSWFTHNIRNSRIFGKMTMQIYFLFRILCQACDKEETLEYKLNWVAARPFFFWTWLARFWASGVSAIDPRSAMPSHQLIHWNSASHTGCVLHVHVTIAWNLVVSWHPIASSMNEKHNNMHHTGSAISETLPDLRLPPELMAFWKQNDPSSSICFRFGRWLH